MPMKNVNTAFELRDRKPRRLDQARPATLRVLNTPILHCVSTIDPEWRLAMIAQAAYFLAERRGFAPGGEEEDWLAAEEAIDAELAAGHTPVPRHV